MELVEDASIVRGMIRVERGEDLVDSLVALARVAGWREAFVTGAGELELVELAKGESTITFADAEVIALSGRVHRGDDDYEVALRTSLLVGASSAEGRIVAAMSRGMVLVVDAIVLEGHVAGPSASTPPVRPTAKPAAAPSVPSAPSAPEASPSAPHASPSAPHASPSAPQASPSAPHASPSTPQASPSAPRASEPKHPFDAPNKALRPPKRRASSPDLDDDDENPQVEAGDVILHPQLGHLDVVGDDAGGGTKVRMQSGKVRVLRLDALIVVEADEEIAAGEGRTFRVKGPRRRTGRF